MGFEIAIRCERCQATTKIDDLVQDHPLQRAEWPGLIEEAKASDWQEMDDGWVCPDCLAAERYEEDIRETDERDYAAYAAGIVRDIQKNS